MDRKRVIEAGFVFPRDKHGPEWQIKVHITLAADEGQSAQSLAELTALAIAKGYNARLASLENDRKLRQSSN